MYVELEFGKGEDREERGRVYDLRSLPSLLFVLITPPRGISRTESR